jgi:DNA-binding transcriptional ArsR family regulator
MEIRFHPEVLPYYEAYVALGLLLEGTTHQGWKAPLLAAGLEEEADRLYDGRLALLQRVQEEAFPLEEVAAALLRSGGGTGQDLYSAGLLACEAIPHRLEQLTQMLAGQEDSQRQRMIAEQLADLLDAPEPVPEDTLQFMTLLEKAGLDSENKYHLLWLYHHSLEAARALEGALCAGAQALHGGLASFAPEVSRAMAELEAQPDLHAYLERETGVTVPREMDIDVYPSILLMGAVFSLEAPQGPLRVTWGIDFLESRRLHHLAKTKTVDCGEALRVLAEKTKFEILLALRERPRYGSEVAELLDLRPATVSHHMGELLKHGLITVTPKQNRIYYSLRPERIRQVLGEVGDLFGEK